MAGAPSSETAIPRSGWRRRSASSSAGGAVSDLTPGITVTPQWFAWAGNDRLLVNQNARGKLQVAAYTVSGNHASMQAPYFTLPAAIGSGTAALSLSLSADAKQVAYQQSSYALAARRRSR